MPVYNKPSPKPFVLVRTDIAFILDQVKFRPLFDSNGNALILWDGIGAIYDGQGGLTWNGPYNAAIPDAASAIATYGQSYQSVTDLAGLRDVTGNNNNLTLVNAHWGRSIKSSPAWPQLISPIIRQFIRPPTLTPLLPI